MMSLSISLFVNTIFLLVFGSHQFIHVMEFWQLKDIKRVLLELYPFSIFELFLLSLGAYLIISLFFLCLESLWLFGFFVLLVFSLFLFICSFIVYPLSQFNSLISVLISVLIRVIFSLLLNHNIFISEDISLVLSVIEPVKTNTSNTITRPIFEFLKDIKKHDSMGIVSSHFNTQKPLILQQAEYMPTWFKDEYKLRYILQHLATQKDELRYLQFPGLQGNLFCNFSSTFNLLGGPEDLCGVDYTHDAYLQHVLEPFNFPNSIDKMSNHELSKFLWLHHLSECQFVREYIALKAYLFETYPGQSFWIYRDLHADFRVVNKLTKEILILDIKSINIRDIDNPVRFAQIEAVIEKPILAIPNCRVILCNNLTDYAELMKRSKFSHLLGQASPASLKRMFDHFGVIFENPIFKRTEFFKFKSLGLTMPLGEGVQTITEK